MTFSPLRVDFRFRGLMAEADMLVHLDGILSAAALEAALASGEAMDRKVKQAALDLPLDRYVPVDRPDCWVFKASALVMERTGHTHLRFRTRRFEREEYGAALTDGRLNSRRNIISQGSGSMRAALLWDPVEVVWKASAWCVGEKAAIESLLPWISGIGALRKNGLGELVSVEVFEDEEAHQRWLYRQLPEEAPGYAPMLVQLQPPYWRRPGRVQGFVPVEPMD